MVSSRTAVVALLACANVAQAFVAPSAAHKLARPLDAKAKGGFGAAPSAKTEKKKPKKDEGPALARPWDNDGDDDDSKKTRNERRGAAPASSVVVRARRVRREEGASLERFASPIVVRARGVRREGADVALTIARAVETAPKPSRAPAGGKGKSGKKGEGGAAIANPSGGMAAGVKLK